MCIRIWVRIWCSIEISIRIWIEDSDFSSPPTGFGQNFDLDLDFNVKELFRVPHMGNRQHTHMHTQRENNQSSPEQPGNDER